jgi:hypothetical protein
MLSEVSISSESSPFQSFFRSPFDAARFLDAFAKENTGQPDRQSLLARGVQEPKALDGSLCLYLSNADGLTNPLRQAWLCACRPEQPSGRHPTVARLSRTALKFPAPEPIRRVTLLSRIITHIRARSSLRSFVVDMA